MSTSNTIEINGKLYDARTGRLFSKKEPVSEVKLQKNQQSKAPAQSKKTASIRYIDGVRPTGKSSPKKPTAPKAALAKPRSHKAHAPAPNLKKRPQKSQTLHRRGQPAPKIAAEKTFGPATVHQRESVNKRLERAMNISKSSVVNKYHTIKQDIPRTAKKVAPNNIETEVLRESQSHSPQPDGPVGAPSKSTKKPRTTKKHISVIGVAVSILSVVVIVLYLSYLNLPAFSMKIASSRAGFEATLPEFQPTGFNINGPVQYAENVVTINFASSANSRTFKLEQTPSTWDSVALKEDISRQTQNEPLVYQNQGLTVYVFDGKAAWINSEKLFTLDTAGSQLGVDQILKLAAST